MRASSVAVVIALLLAPALTAVAHPGHPHQFVHRTATTSTWWTERFSATGENIVVDLETVGTGELVAHTILLYDGTGKKLSGGVTTLYPGSGAFAGNRVDLSVSSGGARATTDQGGVNLPLVFHSGARDPIIFRCGNTCNPSRQFILVVVSASDNMTGAGFALSADGAASLGNRSGTDARVLTGRMFDGSVVHAVSEVGAVGVSIAQASHATSISGRLVGLYLRSGTGAGTLAVDTPAGRIPCDCSWTDGAAGGYVFRLDDTNVDPDEAYLAYADVEFP